MKNLVVILALLGLVACVESNSNSGNSASADYIEARKSVQLPDSCLQFDSVALGMKFKDAEIIVKSDSDFADVRTLTQGSDSVIEFKHNLLLEDGTYLGLTGQVIDYNGLVERISLKSISNGFDYPVREEGNFYKVALLYAHKYGYEPQRVSYQTSRYTTITYYEWEKFNDNVRVSFELSAVTVENGTMHTGTIEISYLDKGINNQRRANQEQIDSVRNHDLKEKSNSQNI